MLQEELTINLDLPPSQRWTFLAEYKTEINDLLECYLNDFTGAESLLEQVKLWKHALIPQSYLEEIACVASFSKYSEDQVLVANLYYDILKLYLGCTAFAVEQQDQLFHARNLDWWTDQNLLSTHSRIFNYQRNGKTVFKTVGWLGFIGAFSGVRPGAFSISLNAVSSQDAYELAMPITFLLRDILEQAVSFTQAREQLEHTTIASDCLLLLTGTQKGEKVVIERTPSRSATRTSTKPYITVTNDYKLLENSMATESELQATSCGRYDQAEALLHQKIPQSPADCLAILQNEHVMMGITVQQMVFTVATGEIELIKTEL